MLILAGCFLKQRLTTHNATLSCHNHFLANQNICNITKFYSLLRSPDFSNSKRIFKIDPEASSFYLEEINKIVWIFNDLMKNYARNIYSSGIQINSMWIRIHNPGLLTMYSFSVRNVLRLEKLIVTHTYTTLLILMKKMTSYPKRMPHKLWKTIWIIL